MKVIDVNPAWKNWDKEYLSVYIDDDGGVWSHHIFAEDGDRIFFGDFVDGSVNEPCFKPLKTILFKIESEDYVALTADEAREFANAILDIVGKK